MKSTSLILLVHISAFLGNMAYSYIYSQSDYGVENNINNTTNNSIEINTNEVINMNDFCLIDEKLNETEVNYTKKEDRTLRKDGSITPY